MLDLFRFLAATFTTLIAVHWAYNIAWLGAAPPLVLIALPFKKIYGFEFLVFVAHVFQYYIMIGLLAIIRRNWQVDYPELSLWNGLLSAIIASTWMFGNYFRKKQQEDLALGTFQAVDERDFDESYNRGEDWMALRRMVPWYLAAAFVGLLMSIVSLFALEPFINGLTQTVSSWYDYVLKVPLLPMVLAIAGFIMAVKFVIQGFGMLAGGAVIGGSAILNRNRTEEE